jgi:hypothetical protein
MNKARIKEMYCERPRQDLQWKVILNIRKPRFGQPQASPYGGIAR